MHRRGLARRIAFCLLAVAALGGCGGKLDVPDAGAAKPSNPLALDASGKAPAADAPHVYCPEIVVLEGAAASQFHSGNPPSNSNLRHQFSLGEVARECALQGDQLTIKVGLSGNVLLGPAGSPGSFSVPLRVAVIRQSDEKPVVSKLYRAPATIGAGQTQASFTMVSDTLSVPFIHDHAEDDYSIKVGIDEGSGAEKSAGKSGK
ncbi:hypothetical protein [Methylocapsa palsarum]|uniref:Lipoprotein n=1 Tax=Methylocapsa palsarum TaxID=1612308 RepID=A0A1I3WBM6_9HYPH|nr:hypothetical protein [Methylocapsa palsarum]SFK04968.1 hypothetical protein SAMN05444581_101497 [Methylocapsa palsarum]